MGNVENTSATQGSKPRVSAVRDLGYEAEVRREIIRGMSERETHSLPANLLGWMICCVAAAALPFAEAFVLPLLLRLLSMALTRHIANRLRARMVAGLDVERTISEMAASLGFAGFTWALLLYPLIRAEEVSSPAIAIVGVTVIAVSMITIICGPVTRALVAFITPFALTFLAQLVWGGGAMDPWIVAAMMSMLGAVASFSLFFAHQQRVGIEMLVENRCLGDELQSALAHAEYLSTHDPLTGLLNRRALGEIDLRLESEEVHVLALDLDHFKQINDRYGHATGDAVLVAAANTMRQVLGALPGAHHDALRIGGEEFLVVLRDVDRTLALSIGETLLHRLRDLGETLFHKPKLVSASIGIASLAQGEQLEHALTRADAALYEAKENGRNRIQRAAA